MVGETWNTVLGIHYEHGRHPIGFDVILDAIGPESDEAVAELIRADRYAANMLGQPVEYDRYFSVLELDQMPAARAAAMEAHASSVYDLEDDASVDTGTRAAEHAAQASERGVVGTVRRTRLRRAGATSAAPIGSSQLLLACALLFAIIWAAWAHLGRAELAEALAEATAMVQEQEVRATTAYEQGQADMRQELERSAELRELEDEIRQQRAANRDRERGIPGGDPDDE